jgi:hypothetical protein
MDGNPAQSPVPLDNLADVYTSTDAQAEPCLGIVLESLNG